MTGTSFTVDLDDVKARAALAHWEAADGDLGELMDVIGGALRDNVLDRFEHGRGPDGTPWKKSERATRQSGQTLVDTARLRDSITYAASSRDVTVGSNVIYAAIHQFGGTIRAKTARGLLFTVPGADGDELVNVMSVNLPARPYLGIGPEDHDAVADLVGAWLRAPVAGPPSGLVS